MQVVILTLLMLVEASLEEEEGVGVVGIPTLVTRRQMALLMMA